VLKGGRCNGSKGWLWDGNVGEAPVAALGMVLHPATAPKTAGRLKGHHGRVRLPGDPKPRVATSEVPLQCRGRGHIISGPGAADASIGVGRRWGFG